MTAIDTWQRITAALDSAGAWIALLPIRLLLAYEFAKAGFGKLNGDNWFENVQDKFLFPFNVVPVDISWFLATWVEILGGLCLAVGLFTRFWAASLAILTVIAIFAVHWPESWDSLGQLWQGYAVTDKGFGNYRIPLLFLAMLVPLIFLGAGKLSMDCVLDRTIGPKST
ncbi:MAG TPA: DoxX family protein [Woeseiaceae bacterium]|nr:DoxX family protein [Woeseiaceae bacterium]